MFKKIHVRHTSKKNFALPWFFWANTTLLLATPCSSTNTSTLSTAPSRLITGNSHELYQSGSTNNVSPKTRPALLLVGGGTDRHDAMKWFVERAGFGDIVVLRGSGSDGYNTMLMDLGANSVASFVIKSPSAAKDSAVLAKIREAEGIFFAGGDQSDYAKNFANSDVARAVNAAAKRGIPVGGSSAGLAILGEFYFPAYKDTITSETSLANPYHERLVLDRNLLSLPYLSGVITDSHFQNRDRLGRLVTFMARILRDGGAPSIRGVGIDEEVALAIGEDGDSTVFADNGSVYLLEPASKPEICEHGKALSFPQVLVRKLRSGSRFNFKRWAESNEVTYALHIKSGKIYSENSPIY